MTTVYLAHGYAEPVKTFGLQVMRDLELCGIEVINPFIRGEQAKYDEFVERGLEFPDEVCAEIVNMDLEKIDRSHGIVAVPSTSSIGTFMEIFYASYMQDKPVFTLWMHGGRQHPWLRNLTNLYMGKDETTYMQFIEAISRWSDERTPDRA